jgi:hypothetical protein
LGVYHHLVARRERDVLERAVHAVAEQAAKTSTVIDEAMEAGLAADHPVTVGAKQVRLELLNVKADLERELGKLVFDCTACGQEVHWVQGVSMADPGHWGHRFPAPHLEPALSNLLTPIKDAHFQRSECGHRTCRGVEWLTALAGKSRATASSP